MSKKKLVILASGAGSNARNIINYFGRGDLAEIVLIASNKHNAGVLDIAAEFGIETYLLDKNNLTHSNEFLDKLRSVNPDLIVLAGFLLKVPQNIVDAFPNKIVNIHPALLPKYGGKGMYGHFVHEAVYAAGEKESGITIHFVNCNYDEGDIIFQQRVSLTNGDTPASIEAKVRALEIECFPAQIELLLKR